MRDSEPWKRCQKCREWKHVPSEFYAKKNSIWGNNPCISCLKEYRQENIEAIRKRDRSRRWRRWGLSDEEFLSLYESLDGRCEICLSPTDIDEIKCDHNHTTDLFRGLLCTNCNVALGHFRDDVEVLSRAIGYLRKGI